MKHSDLEHSLRAFKGVTGGDGVNPPTSAPQGTSVLRKLRVVLCLFILGLVLSGLTAFPLQRELEVVAAARGLDRLTPGETANSFDRWILNVRDGLRESYPRHPWLAYGTDWLAFGHIVIAIFFIGALRDPVRNIWVLKAGLIACALVFPLALVCGEIRQIPFGWRLMDCSFGAVGAIPLYYCLKLARAMGKARPEAACGNIATGVESS